MPAKGLSGLLEAIPQMRPPRARPKAPPMVPPYTRGSPSPLTRPMDEGMVFRPDMSAPDVIPNPGLPPRGGIPDLPGVRPVWNEHGAPAYGNSVRNLSPDGVNELFHDYTVLKSQRGATHDEAVMWLSQENKIPPEIIERIIIDGRF